MRRGPERQPVTRPTEVERAEVWRDSERVGTITRTRHGSVFEYDEGFFAQHQAAPGGVAIHLPYAQRHFECRGANLHPFFAGLLPEGIRLRALVQHVKTSEDDLLSLLIAAGEDTVGDLSVVPEGHGGAVTEAQPPLTLGQLRFSELLAQSLAQGGTGEPSVPGVQEKVSASTISLPLRSAGPHAHILKLNPKDKPRLIQNEAFFMEMAKACGIEVAPTRLVHDRDGEAGLLVERFDRRWSKATHGFERLHQEDACQFLDRYPADKYRIGVRAIAEALGGIVVAPALDQLRLIRQVVFSYLIANGDLHAKNVSVLWDDALRGFRLSPAYDLLSTLPYGDRRMALKVDGRDDRLSRKGLVAFASRFQLKPLAVHTVIDAVCDVAPPWLERLEEIGLDPRKTNDLRRVAEKRREALGARS
jgi:serine/threonine-protein kinase HipA